MNYVKKLNRWNRLDSFLGGVGTTTLAFDKRVMELFLEKLKLTSLNNKFIL